MEGADRIRLLRKVYKTHLFRCSEFTEIKTHLKTPTDRILVQPVRDECVRRVMPSVR
jgi:hypothetical protein